jgi:hypothetical protein
MLSMISRHARILNLGRLSSYLEFDPIFAGEAKMILCEFIEKKAKE